MTQTLQPGQHPDADQLTAFAEHALPPHEQQQMLAHLAACSDCRGIVYLAQEAVPAALAEPKPIPAHKPWFSLFSGWRLAVPAAALACLVFVTAHLHNRAMEDSMNAAAEKTARVEPVPPPAPPPPPPAQRAADAQPAPLKATVTEPPKPQLRPAAPGASLDLKNQSAGALHGTAQGGGVAGYAASQGSAFAGDELKAQTASRQSSLGMVSAGNFAAAKSAPAPAAPMPGSLSGPLPANAALQTATLDAAAAQPAAATPAPARAATALHSLNQQYSAAPPLPPPPPQAQTAVAGAASETVTVSSASAQVETNSTASAGLISSASFNSLAKARVAKKQEPALPSHLPVLATATAPRQQLALDIAGALFRSQDAGVTWQPVPVQWTGHAVKVALTPKPPALAKDSAPPAPATFVLTNDTGQLWTSPDGLLWKHQ